MTNELADAGKAFLQAALCILLLIVYFVPTMIAVRRRKRNVTPIFILNLLGCTTVGWVIALAWALTVERVDLETNEPDARTRAVPSGGGTSCGRCGHIGESSARFCASCGWAM